MLMLNVEVNTVPDCRCCIRFRLLALGCILYLLAAYSLKLTAAFPTLVADPAPYYLFPVPLQALLQFRSYGEAGSPAFYYVQRSVADRG